MLIYKILLPAEWSEFEATGTFTGSTFDLSSGFIHCSSRSQVATTAERFFADEPELVVAVIDADALGDAVRWETASNGELFPHVYSPISLDAVAAVHEIDGAGAKYRASVAAHDALLALSDKAYDRLRQRLDDLTDEEYLWEPAPGCWSVRVDAGNRPTFDFGLLPAEQPVTTIAWRLAHIVDLLKEDRCAVLLGLEPDANADELWLTTNSDEATEFLATAYRTWRRYLEATDPAALDGPVEGGRWPDRQTFALHILDEFIHHGAEIGVLRDVYAATRTDDALVIALMAGDRDAVTRCGPSDIDRLRTERPHLMAEMAAAGRWQAVDLLIDLGFDVDNAPAPSALHHAAGLGRAALVRKLVEHGADTTAVDERFNATPLQWAQTMSQRLGGPHASGADWASVIEDLSSGPAVSAN